MLYIITRTHFEIFLPSRPISSPFFCLLLADFPFYSGDMRAICYCLIFPVTPRRNNREKRNKNNIVAAAAAAAATTTTLDTSKIAFLVLYSVAVAVGIEFRHCEMGVNLSRRQRERGTEKLLKWTFSLFSLFV